MNDDLRADEKIKQTTPTILKIINFQMELQTIAICVLQNMTVC